ncbi:hypothetical protein TNIN_499381 [Trichonephila inaurata madagascariensis]|uniref:Uncharacterized protein n=1 Tax=Trichonephila inaurata madagascariensis TaxID=2747483 RepID=A0A8X6WYH2_9ARAC|nr:hypothetical protein TNIN_499381 [Trichonephila inaurata madagascariensis]
MSENNTFLDVHLLEMDRIITEAEKRINLFRSTEEVHLSLNNLFEEYRIQCSFQDTKYKLATWEQFKDLVKEKEDLDTLMRTAQLCLADVWTQANSIKNFSSIPLVNHTEIASIFEPIYLRSVEGDILRLAEMTKAIMLKCALLLKSFVNIGEEWGQPIDIKKYDILTSFLFCCFNSLNFADY